MSEETVTLTKQQLKEFLKDRAVNRQEVEEHLEWMVAPLFDPDYYKPKLRKPDRPKTREELLDDLRSCTWILTEDYHCRGLKHETILDILGAAQIPLTTEDKEDIHV